MFRVSFKFLDLDKDMVTSHLDFNTEEYDCNGN